MELGFQVKDLGPLNQVALPIISLDTCVYLASHAYGWWRSHARALTFEQILANNSTTLRPILTFNERRYLELREKHGGIIGVAASGKGSLSLVNLPKASTASTGDQPRRGLRALIVGLSCFASVHQICTILKEIFPDFLLEHDLEDHHGDFSGALVAALTEYVSAAIEEEHIDKIQGWLYGTLQAQLDQIKGVTVQQLLLNQQTDLAQVIGFLGWMLTPSYRRSTRTYPTRSLNVWSLSIVFSELGFEIEPSRYIVTAPYKLSQDQGAFREDQADVPEVCLILSPGWPTDPGAAPNSLLGRIKLERPARIIPIRAIPTIAFQQFVEKHPGLELKPLEDAFLDSFETMQKLARSTYFICAVAGLPCDLQRMDELKINNGKQSQDRRSAEASLFGARGKLPKDRPNAVVFCYGGGSKETTGSNCEDDSEIMDDFLEPMILKHAIGLDSPQWKTPHNIAVARLVSLATVLAILSLFTRKDGELPTSALDLDFVYDSPFTKVAKVTGDNQIKQASYDEIGTSCLSQRWCTRMGHALWMMEAVFNPHSESLNVVFGPNDASIRSYRRRLEFEILRRTWGPFYCEVFTGASHNSKVIFGAQNNGLAVVSKFALQPSIDKNDSFIFNIRRGQLLDIPLKDNVLIDGLSHQPKHTERMVLDRSHRLIDDPSQSNLQVDWLRWDIEPCWETDVQASCLNLRTNGLSRFQLGLQSLSQSVEEHGHRAKCLEDHSAQSIHSDVESVRRKEATRKHCWFGLPLLEMVQQGQHAVGGINDELNQERPHWLVHAHDSEILALLALTCAFVPSLKPNVRLVASCWEAGLEKAEELGYPEKSVMIIIFNPTAVLQS
ncbi:MAG: hypothetical protein M1837_004497 [Sclerophora amabilis]|nr:MAG: hypothetical protein M1837_004497 [Sclerophora amabilis]